MSHIQRLDYARVTLPAGAIIKMKINVWSLLMEDVSETGIDFPVWKNVYSDAQNNK